MPKKPSHPLGHIVFPKDGAPHQEQEVLPWDKDQLEEVLARKFAESLRVRFGLALGSPVRGDRFPDFLTHEGTREIWLELTEVRNPELRGRLHTKAVEASVDYARGLLTATICEKLDKNYQRPSEAALWLLAYDNTTALLWDSDYAADRAMSFLQTVNHPFSGVWVMNPTTGEIPSFLESVWPTREYTSTERRP